MNDDGGDCADAADFLDELIVGAEKAAVDEVVALDSGEGGRVRVLLKLRHIVRIDPQEAGRAFPGRPGACRAGHDTGVPARQPLVVRAHHVGAFGLWNGLDVLLPLIRIQRRRSARVLIEPFELPAAQQEDAAQHQFGHASGMRFRVSQRQRGAP